MTGNETALLVALGLAVLYCIHLIGKNEAIYRDYYEEFEKRLQTKVDVHTLLNTMEPPSVYSEEWEDYKDVSSRYEQDQDEDEEDDEFDTYYS